MCPEDFSDSANLQEINNYTNLTVKAFTTDLPLRYRTGQPLYIQDWGDGVGHAISLAAGTGAESTYQVNKFLTKRASWLLKAGSDGGRQAKVTIRQGPYEKAKISFEWAMTWDDDIDYFEFTCTWVDGTTYYWVEFYIDVSEDEIQIYDNALGYVSIRTPINLYADDDNWNYFKLTVDLTEAEWVEAYINEDTIDLSDYTLYSDTAVAGDPLDVYWKLRGDAGANPAIYVDGIAMILED